MKMHSLKQTARLILKNKIHTLLLLFSLSVGLISFILLSAKVSYNNSFDTYLESYKNTYRIISSSYTDKVLNITQPLTQRAVGETLKASYPEVSKAGYLCIPMNNHFSFGDNSFTEGNAFHCSSGFLSTFDVKITHGKTDKLLSDPYKVIVSESFASRHAGDEDLLGKIIYQYPGREFVIEAVYKDFPENCHFRPEMLISFHDNMHLPPPLKDNWGEYSFYTYIVLDAEADIAKIEAGINQVCTDHNNNFESGSEYKFTLQPIKDIHTKSNLPNELSQNVNGTYLNILQLISILILIVSGFNYIYFSYTRISGNSAQFGARKAMGGSGSSLLRQFLSESLTYHTLALVFSVLFIDLLRILPANIHSPVPFADLPISFWSVLVLVFIASSFVNPLIILLMLSSKTALELLSNNFSPSKNTFSFRQFFTVFQFAIIVFLISTIFGISNQLSFLERKNKGFDLSDKLIIQTPANLTTNSDRVNNLQFFEQEMARIAGVEDISMSSNVPGDILSFNFNATEQEESNGIKTSLFVTDKNFIDLYKIPLMAGSGFLTNENNSGCIINESCMINLGYNTAADVLGRKLYLKDESGLQTFETFVIGVCHDFNFSSVMEHPAPTALINLTNNRIWGNYTLSINPNMDNTTLLSKVENTFRETFPGYSFEYFWLEDYYNLQFAEEDDINSNLRRFAIVAIVLGILSLLSMVWHDSQSRAREIGIRKVNGAEPSEIIKLLNINFSKWIGISAIIGVPSSWYFLSLWLDSFVFKEPIKPWIFIVSSGLALIIGLTVVSLQSLKVANMNPTDSIRND